MSVKEIRGSEQSKQCLGTANGKVIVQSTHEIHKSPH